MDIQQLRYFLRLCADKNFLSAANNLYITQQALRKSIKKLEADAGGPLFYKESDSLELTRKGLCVKQHARNIVQEMNVLERSLQHIDDSEGQIILIASSYGVYPKISKRAFNKFFGANPQIVERLVELPDIACENSVANGDTDVGFCIGPNNLQYVDAYPLEYDDVVALMNKSHPLAQRDHVTIDDLEDCKLAIVNDNFKLNLNFRAECRKIGFEPDIVLMGGDVVSVHSFAQFEGHVAITVGWLANDMPGNSELVAIPLRSAVSWQINLLVNKHRKPTPAAARYIEFVKDEFGCK